MAQEKTKACVWCGNVLRGRQRKFCSASCKTLEHRARNPEYAEAQKASRREWGRRNRKTLSLKNREWKAKNPIPKGKQAAYSRKYREQNKEEFNRKSRERMARKRASDPAFAKAQRAACTSYYQRKMAEDPVFRMVKNMRRRLQCALKAASAGKARGTMQLCGCSGQALAQHLERQFQPGMTWENYGQWHVDHIRPCASFDLTDPAQQQECFHYSNLQPLWAVENIKKGARMPPDPFHLLPARA